MNGLTWKYVLHRIGIYLLTIFISITLIFLISRAVPGDPIENMWRQLEMQKS